MILTKTAGIDIGSNAIRLLISNVVNDEGEITYIKTALIRAPVRLGGDTFSTKTISPEVLQKMEDALRAFSLMMKVYEVSTYKACATSALRESSNAAYVIKHLKEKTGIDIEIIDGDREAEIIYKTQIEHLISMDKNYLFIDVGGGSTELTVFVKKKPMYSESFKIGTVRMLKHKAQPSEFKRMEKWLTEHITQKHINVVGSGGNINSIFKMSKTELGQGMSLKYLKTLQKELLSKTYEERIRDYQFNPDRADVIMPALEIFIKVMSIIDSTQIIVPKIGLTDGLVRLAYQASNQNIAESK